MAVLFAAGIWLLCTSRHAPMRRPGEAQVVVCIDPGHPSETNSARRILNGTSELYINWVVALKLQSILAQDGRVRAVLTKNSMDQFVSNRDRAVTANNAKASLSIHLHCDAGPNHGFTIYYPDRQGEADGRYGPMREIRIASQEAAAKVHDGMREVLGEALKDRGVKGESFTKIGRKYGGLTTSIWSDVPTITVEMVFLNSRYDARFIKSEKGQQRMANALALGIRRYLGMCR